MAAFRTAMTCRILLVLFVTVLWIGIWYSRMLPQMPAFSSSSLRKSAFRRLKGNLSRNSSFSSSFWDMEDRQLTDDLIGEVMEELEKIRDSKVQKFEDPDIRCEQSRSEKISTRIANNRSSQQSLSNSSFQAVGWSLHSLVLSSISRLSMEEFSAVGLASTHLRDNYGDPVQSCSWVPRVDSYSAAAALATSNDSSVVWGKVAVLYVNESQSSPYDVAVLRCSFGEPVGANGAGGVLVVNVTTPAEEQVAVFQEKPEEIGSIQFEGPFRFDYAYCSPPVAKNMSEKYVKEWLMYHQGLWDGRIHYFIYDAGGVDSKLMNIFQPLIEKKLLTIVGMRESSRLYPTSDSGHRLSINDCLQRSRFVANWALFWDFDEYFQMVDSNYTSMSALLQKHERAPWVSLGNLIWSRTYCAPAEETESRLAIERMCFRLRHPTCGDEKRANTCHGVEGQRKWIANPRKVLMATIHRTLEPEWNGVILDATVARLNHYHELAVAGSEDKNCWVIKNPADYGHSTVVDGWWWKDVSSTLVARDARNRSDRLDMFSKPATRQE